MEFQHYSSCPEYLDRESISEPRFNKIMAGDAIGVKWDYAFFRFERYMTNTEPETSSKRRLIIWQPMNEIGKPIGWKQSILRFGHNRGGYAQIGSIEDYFKDWSAHALRERFKWYKQSELKIFNVSHEEYIQAYKKSPIVLVLRNIYVNIIKKKFLAHGDRLKFFVVKNKAGKLLAGIGVLDIPEIKTSYHLVSFINKEARNTGAGVGLIDHWFKDLASRGYHFIDFGVFWAPGDPKDWKGFSRFKSQFATRIIDYPKPFIKFQW